MKNLHRRSKSRNTLIIRYGQSLITVSSPPIGLSPALNKKSCKPLKTKAYSVVSGVPERT